MSLCSSRCDTVGRAAVQWTAFNEKRALDTICDKIGSGMDDITACIEGARQAHADRDVDAYVEGEACRSKVVRQEFRVDLTASMPLLEADNAGGSQSRQLTSPLKLPWRLIEESANRTEEFIAYLSHDNVLSTYADLYGDVTDRQAVAPVYFEYDGKGSDYDPELLVTLDADVMDGAPIDIVPSSESGDEMSASEPSGDESHRTLSAGPADEESHAGAIAALVVGLLLCTGIIGYMVYRRYRQPPNTRYQNFE